MTWLNSCARLYPHSNCPTTAAANRTVPVPQHPGHGPNGFLTGALQRSRGACLRLAFVRGRRFPCIRLIAERKASPQYCFRRFAIRQRSCDHTVVVIASWKSSRGVTLRGSLICLEFQCPLKLLNPEFPTSGLPGWNRIPPLDVMGAVGLDAAVIRHGGHQNRTGFDPPSCVFQAARLARGEYDCCHGNIVEKKARNSPRRDPHTNPRSVTSAPIFSE